MGNAEFQYNCIKLVEDYLLEENPNRGDFEIYVVWMCKALQNNKALLSTDIVGDTRYYEITYNGDKGEFYFDVYVKLINRRYDDEGHIHI